jgi:hypothetical protein
LNHSIQLCYIHGVVHAQWWLKGTLFPMASNNLITHHKIQILNTRNIWCYCFENHWYWWSRLKRKGGMIEVDWGRTRGLLVRTRGTIVGGEQIFGKTNGFALANLFGNTLSIQLLRMVLHRPKPQTPPLHKPSMPQSKAPRFWGKTSSPWWPCKSPTCMPSYVRLGNLDIGCNYFTYGCHA